MPNPSRNADAPPERSTSTVHEWLSQEPSVNLLTEREYRLLKQCALHDQPMSIRTWALFLGLVLNRTFTDTEAADVLAEYNARLRKEY